MWKFYLDGVSGIFLCECKHICCTINKISNEFEYGFIENFYNNGYYYQSVPLTQSENTMNSTLKIECNGHRQTMEWHPGNTPHLQTKMSHEHSHGLSIQLDETIYHLNNLTIQDIVSK